LHAGGYMSNKTKGTIAIIIASLGFAWMSIFVRLAGDVPVAQKVWFRNIISMFVTGSIVFKRHGIYFGQKKHRKVLLLRSALGTVGMLLFFYSLGYLPTSDANMLNKLSTFFLLIFSLVFLKENLSKLQLGMIVLAFFGTILIIKPEFDFSLSPYLTSVLAAMFAGGAYTTLRVLGGKEDVTTTVFFFSTFSVVFLSPFVICDYIIPTMTQLLYLLLIGVFATIGQIGTTYAYKLAPASEISIFNYFNVVFATLIAIPLFHESPDILSLFGYLMIFLAAYTLYRFQSQKNHQKRSG